MVLSKLAMKGAFDINNIDSILMRVLMQWMAVSSVLTRFDLSHVEVFFWSKSHIEASFTREASKEDRDGETPAHSNSANVLFQFPPWFRHSIGHVLFFSGSIVTENQ